jgi:hypothetical protein
MSWEASDFKVLVSIASALERIAKAQEEANRWVFTSTKVESFRICRRCSKHWVEGTMGWIETQTEHPGCPSCRVEEADG